MTHDHAKDLCASELGTLEDIGAIEVLLIHLLIESASARLNFSLLDRFSKNFTIFALFSNPSPATLQIRWNCSEYFKVRPFST